MKTFLIKTISIGAQYLQTLIDVSVQNDTNKFYSYFDFANNLSNQINIVTDICPGITQLMDQRVSYLSNYSAFLRAYY